MYLSTVNFSGHEIKDCCCCCCCTGSQVQSFPRAFPSSSDVPVLLLNQHSVSLMGTRLQRSVGEACAARESRNKRYSRIPSRSKLTCRPVVYAAPVAQWISVLDFWIILDYTRHYSILDRSNAIGYSLLWREKYIQLPPHPTPMTDLGKNHSQTKFPPVR